MGVISASAFRRSVRSLEQEELAAFVAALYTARGHEATAGGSVVHIERDAGTDVYAIVAEGGVDAGDVDGVVVASSSIPSPRNGRYVGPDELRRLLLYGVDRPDAEELCR